MSGYEGALECPTCHQCALPVLVGSATASCCQNCGAVVERDRPPQGPGETPEGDREQTKKVSLFIPSSG
jgi:hypothetical protein